MSRRPVVCSNWRCKIDKLEVAKRFVAELNDKVDDAAVAKIDVILCPSVLHATVVKQGLSRDRIAVGLQDISSQEQMECFTGEVSATTAADCGVEWVIVGHAERRHRGGETNEEAAAKAQRALDAGLGVIFCIGELLDEREAGRTVEVCGHQLVPALPKAGKERMIDWSKFVIAYEPVWAMGTGVAATREQAQEAHEAVREIVKDNAGQAAAESVRIVYGGIVNARSCEGFILQPDIDGFLGQATNPNDFAAVVLQVANNV